MSSNAQAPNIASSISDPALPVVAPSTPVVAAPPEWRPGMSPQELEAFRAQRDLFINGNIARIVEERRASGYTPKGEPLINPLGVPARVTSLPAESRFHPVLREDIAHSGIDMVPAHVGRSKPRVYAASSATVVYVGRFSERAGQFIMALDDDNRIVCYAHLAEGSTRSIRVGDHIPQGQQIAFMGSTGPVDAKGRPLLMPHLHFGVRVLGEAGQRQSVLAQVQRVAMRMQDIQPLGEDFIEDPALNYTMYDVVHPAFEGATYRRVGARIPAPTDCGVLVARDVTAEPDVTAAVAPAPVVEPIPEFPAGVSGGEHTMGPDSVQTQGGSPRLIDGLQPPR